VDVFLHFFEAKSLRKNLWVSFNEIAGRMFLTLFQKSYKGFRGKFFRVCSSEADPTAFDGFPLYWVGKLKLKKAKTLDELSSADREVCQVFANLGVMFNTAELIKHEYDPVALSRCIDMGVIPSLLFLNSLSLFMLLLLACFINLFLYCFHDMLNSQLFLLGADMTLGAEKRKRLAKVLSVRGKATLGGLVPLHNQPLMLSL